jgi:hypothetical protein
LKVQPSGYSTKASRPSVIVVGTSTVPLARITPEKTLPSPSRTAPQTAMCSSLAASSTTCGSVMNKPTMCGASSAASTASPPVSATFMPRPTRVTESTCSSRPPPMACAASTDAVIEIDIAGNCT